MEGRVTGRKTEDGSAYELVQLGKVLRSIPMDEARNDKKLAAAIDRNRWEVLE